MAGSTGSLYSKRIGDAIERMATRNRLELSTSSVTGWRSNQLNYRARYEVFYFTGKPGKDLAGAEGIEPSARGFGDRCSTC